MTALLELRLPSVSAQKIYLLEVMQHLHFLSTMVEHVNRKKSGGDGEQAFHNLKQGTATLQK